ncbi:M36 family metallopeptidase [Thermaerobacter litoralis]
MPKRRRLAATASLVAAALIALSFLTAPAQAFQGLDARAQGDEPAAALAPALDIRADLEALDLPALTREAAEALATEVGSGLRIRWNAFYKTPSMITRSQGYLTGPAEGPAVDIARRWLREHKDLFGWTDQVVDGLKVVRDYALPGTGLHPVTFQQTFGGIETAAGGRIIVAVNREGRILSVAASAQPAAPVKGGFDLSVTEALGKVVGALAPAVDYLPKVTGTRAGWTVLAQGPFATEQYARKALFPMGRELRPVWRVLFIPKLTEGYEVLVDATSGEILYRRALVNFSGPEGLVFENYPGAPAGGQQVVKSFAGDPAASPKGWVGVLPGVNGPTTFGNNADTYANWSNFLVPEAPGLVRPVNLLSHFNYAFTDQWGRTQCQATPPSYAEDVEAAVTNLFYHHNLFHDHLYKLGWTEPAGNLQLDNFGKGGQGGDPILGLAQAGALTGGAPLYTGRDNAYMLTLPDGLPSWSGMFLWEPIPGSFEGKCADGDFDAGVIYHEYSHALSNRLVAGGEALNSHQAGSMGEAWGDWYGMSYLIARGLQDRPIVGRYVTGNAKTGIRNYALDQSPLGFGDIGYDITGPEVHADGEIWAAILWDVWKALVAKYGKVKGAQIAEQLVTDAMPISAPDPSMIDMRDAILTADVDRYHGDHFDLLWTAFARRGLGAGAVSNTGDDTDPHPAFDHLARARNGRLVGTVVNATTGKPIAGARVIVGEYEARVSPAAVTGAKGGFALDMVDGTYTVTIQARGFGARTFRGIKVTAGRTTSLQFSLQPNYASIANGAKVVQVSRLGEDATLPAKNALDDTEATVWATAVNDQGFDGEWIVVDLAGDRPVPITAVQVSAFKDIAKARFAALKDFTLQVSTDGVVWKTILQGSFPTEKPRPVAPALHYKLWTLSTPVQAAYIRFFADSAQDNSLGYAQVAEIQVFGGDRTTAVEPAPLPKEDPIIEEGTVQVGNPTSDTAGGVTQNEFVATCNPNPSTEGLDGWVMELPESFGDGTHRITAAGPGTGTYDFDLYFYAANCQMLGSKASAAADESAVIPGGTRYVVADLWLGANVPLRLIAEPSQ